MEKVYIQVQELLTAYNVPISELMERVKAGTLALYEWLAFDYVKIDSFESYIDSYIAKERERIEKRYIHNITNIQLPNERISYAMAILSNRYNGWKYDREVRYLGASEIAEQRHNKDIKALDDRERVAKYLAWYLYVKSSDYENVANNANAPSKMGRRKDTSRIKKTQDACQMVEREYGCTLANKSKQDVSNLVKAEMGYTEPHIQTFNDWYRNCAHTREAGNPHKNRKPA